MRTISIAVLSLLFFLLCISGCKKEDPITYDCTGLTPTYTINVKPILDANCVSSGCHNSGSKRAGYDLSSYTGARDASAKKEFMGSMQHLSGYSKMSRGKSQLSLDNLRTISCWIENGTPQ